MAVKIRRTTRVVKLRKVEDPRKGKRLMRELIFFTRGHTKSGEREGEMGVEVGRWGGIGEFELAEVVNVLSVEMDGA